MRTLVRPQPCKHCPFRMDVPIYLRPDRRAEIAQSLANDQDFPCHETVEHDDEDAADLSRSQSCAGAVKALAAVGGSTQLVRIAQRLGSDLSSIEAAGADCWDLDTWQRLAEGATADNPTEHEDAEVATCNTVNSGCLAPAGFLGPSGAVISGTEPADLECPSCGEPVCSECADDEGICGSCSEQDEEDW